MKPRITEIVSEMEKYRNHQQVSVQLGLAGELMALVSEEQAESAAIMERHTKKIIGLTWALLVLTFLLFLLTVVLCYDAYQDRHDHDFQNQSTTQE